MGSPALLRFALLLALCAAAACPPREVVVARPPQPIRGVWHRGHAGDTAGELARRYRVAAVDIEELNGLQRGQALDGRLVFVPGAHRGEAPPAPTTQPTLMTPATRPGGGIVARGAFVWPVPNGKVSSGFGLRGRRPHEGIDIAAPEGAAIIASADGRVIYAGSGVRGYGNLILLQHDDGMISVYAHNRRNLVVEKARVGQGQVIAEVGRTGSATASHLHFELRRGERPLDPSRYVHP
jgi:murein DD-endopeptidase MepM/ murein hydrolase activator NlpD